MGNTGLSGPVVIIDCHKHVCSISLQSRQQPTNKINT